MWNSTSRETDAGKRYQLTELEALISYVAWVIESEEDAFDKKLEMEAECDVHYVPFLNGITNGEYFYALFEIFSEMLSAEASKDAPYKEAIIASVLDGMKEDFLENLGNGDFRVGEARKIWELYKACRLGVPLWEDEEGKSIDAPDLEKLTEEDWGRVFENIEEEFLWDRDWELLKEGTFALEDQQPHWPTYQEFRKAKVWLLKTSD